MTRSIGLFLPLLLAVVPFVACGDDSSSTAAADDSGGPSGNDGGGADRALPAAKGDPCRGQPLPAGEHYVPEGLCANLVAIGPAQVRQLTFAPNGDLFAANINAVWLLRDEDGDGYFAEGEIHQWAKTGGNASAKTTSVHVDVAGGFVYSGTPSGVKRWPYSPGAMSGGEGEDVIVAQPTGEHSKHTAHVYDGYLYTHAGSSGNEANENPNRGEYDTARSVIKRFPLASFVSGKPFDWSAGEVVAVGLRNTNGFTRNAAGRIYGVVNGIDDLKYKDVVVRDDNPGEQIVEIAMGKRYGYPFCFTAQRIVAGGSVIPPGTQLFNQGFGEHDDTWCAANSDKPATFVQAHSAPLDIVFFDEQPTGGLPDRWRGGAFVALHGSWNRGPATGYKVVWVPFDANGNSPMPTSTANETTFPYETVLGGGSASGAKDGPWTWQAEGREDAPRPSGVTISPIDGALYIASDSGQGMIYRVGAKR